MKTMLRLLAFGVAFAAAAAGARGAAVERTFPGAGASATVRVDPGEIDPAGEAEAVVSLAASAPFAASVPSDLAASFEGFSCLGAYTDAVGAVHLRLAPDPAAARWRVSGSMGSSRVERSWAVSSEISYSDSEVMSSSNT